MDFLPAIADLYRDGLDPPPPPPPPPPPFHHHVPVDYFLKHAYENIRDNIDCIVLKIDEGKVFYVAKVENTI